MSCHGICEQYRARKGKGNWRYALGQKRCQTCGIFINWNEAKCPCCRTTLRTKTRNKNWRNKLGVK